MVTLRHRRERQWSLDDEAPKKLEEEVSRWPDISVHSHRFGGKEFRFGSAEVGHVHTGGVVDIPFPRSVRFVISHFGRSTTLACQKSVGIGPPREMEVNLCRWDPALSCPRRSITTITVSGTWACLSCLMVSTDVSNTQWGPLIFALLECRRRACPRRPGL